MFYLQRGWYLLEIADQWPEMFLRAYSTFSRNVIQTFNKLFVDDQQIDWDGVFGFFIAASFLLKNNFDKK